MDIYEYWLTHMKEWGLLGPDETEEERKKRLDEWHEYLWDTL